MQNDSTSPLHGCRLSVRVSLHGWGLVFVFMKSHGFTTGGHKRREYQSWSAMRQRCLNPNNIGYKNYGGRGILICEQWNDFFVFYEDMGPCPNGYSIVRKDNNGNYEPSNCKWANCVEQRGNTRQNRYLTLGGITLCVSEWARRVGMPKTTLTNRVNRWGDVHQALTLPYIPKSHSRKRPTKIRRLNGAMGTIQRSA